MKRFLSLCALLAVGCLSFSQTVENIRVEPDGENIKIHYRIGGSTDAQLYNVVLECSMDGGRRFEPRSVIGDVGENIRGGKSYNTIVWDVFEDVEEVGNVEFFVKVELVSDMSPSAVQSPQERVSEPLPQTQGFDAGGSPVETFDRRAFAAYTGSIASPYGISFGLVKNWGVYGSFRFGGYIDDWTNDIWFTAAAGLTKYVFSAGKYRLHGYAGIGTTYESYEEYIYYTSWTDSYLTLDFGIINVFNWISLTLGLEHLTGIETAFVFGLGFVL